MPGACKFFTLDSKPLAQQILKQGRVYLFLVALQRDHKFVPYCPRIFIPQIVRSNVSIRNAVAWVCTGGCEGVVVPSVVSLVWSLAYVSLAPLSLSSADTPRPRSPTF